MELRCTFSHATLTAINSMKNKVIFFDADGVILKGGYRFSDELVKQFGLKAKTMQPFFLGPFLGCAKGQADLKEELAKVIDTWGWHGTVDELIDFWLTEGTVFDETNLELVRKLSEKGIHCFISTHQEKYRGEFIKRKVGSGNPFDDVYYSEEMGCGKQDPHFYEVLFERVKNITTDKSEILLIDDLQSVIELAQKFGFDTIFYQSPDDVRELKTYV